MVRGEERRKDQGETERGRERERVMILGGKAGDKLGESSMRKKRCWEGEEARRKEEEEGERD